MNVHDWLMAGRTPIRDPEEIIAQAESQFRRGSTNLWTVREHIRGYCQTLFCSFLKGPTLFIGHFTQTESKTHGEEGKGTQERRWIAVSAAISSILRIP